MPDGMSDRMPEDMSDRMPEDMPDRMPEDMSDRMPEDMPDRMPEDLPDRMPEHMPEDMPDRMPEDMSDRMPEDLPVRKCINAMVGIIRSEVILISQVFQDSNSFRTQNVPKVLVRAYVCQRKLVLLKWLETERPLRPRLRWDIVIHPHAQNSQNRG